MPLLVNILHVRFASFAGVQLTPAVFNSGGTMLYGSRFSIWPGGFQVSFDIQYGAVSNNPCAYKTAAIQVLLFYLSLSLPALQPKPLRLSCTKATVRLSPLRGRARTRAYISVSTRRFALRLSLKAPMAWPRVRSHHSPTSARLRLLQALPSPMRERSVAVSSRRRVFFCTWS